MNNLKNRVQLIGNLGTNPEVKTFGDGKIVVKLALATNESYKNDKGERVTVTTWHHLTAWNNNATFAKNYLAKGDELCIDGKLKNNTYTDKDGVKRYSVEIEVNEILILRKASVQGVQNQNQQNNQQQPSNVGQEMGDLPF